MIILFPFLVFSQNTIEWSDDFSDGDFSKNPAWNGMSENFIVNSAGQLQLNVASATKSYLSTSSTVFDDATWEFWVRINNTTSNQNYASVYIISDKADLNAELRGYYVMIGNTEDEISLWKQEGSKKTNLIKGESKSIDTNPVIVKIKVTRTKEGEFSLYRQRISTNSSFNDAEFVQEGETVIDKSIAGSKYFGVLAVNSATNGKNYLFDDFVVKGVELVDIIPPKISSLQIKEPNQIEITFSEEVNISNAVFDVNNYQPSSIIQSADKTKITLIFQSDFERGIIYLVSIDGIVDAANNPLGKTEIKTGIVEAVERGDIVINEILFDPQTDGAEFIEVYNVSSKIIDCTTLFFATRNTNKQFSTGNLFPKGYYLFPNDYVAVSQNAEVLPTFYPIPDDANIKTAEKWSALNNTGANLLIGRIENKDTLILDEVSYSSKWHHQLIKNTKVVSLERIHPLLPSDNSSTWHSAASDVNYATPGYKNSQFREIQSIGEVSKKWFFPDPEVFTPDNDGKDDVCFIRYKTAEKGFTASVTIFNSTGHTIAPLASNMLLGEEGYLIWDGKTKNGQNVNPGVYLLYVELVNINSGVKKIEKTPIVVSSR